MLSRTEKRVLREQFIGKSSLRGRLEEEDRFNHCEEIHIESEPYPVLPQHAFINVTIELIDPNKELNPAKCREKNIRSTGE